MSDGVDRAFSAVQPLVERFRANESHYLSDEYIEAQVRQEFIDKFLSALGWDVAHERHPDPWKQEVRIEKPERKSRRRADYAFSVAPYYRRTRFFLEAKQPRLKIVTPDNCFQAIRYGWPQGVPICVLSDFRSLHVIDSRYKPNINTATSRVVRSWYFLDLADREKFAEVYWLLSREAVGGGSIENFAENFLPAPEAAVKQYTLFEGEDKQFDDEFLETLAEWRIALASSFKAAKSTLTGEQLTECVQRTIDRLLFIRFLEDKQIEQHAVVASFGSKAQSHWSDFITTCARLDRTYNGIVFKHHSVIDDKGFEPKGPAFSDLCDELSDSHSPYNFDSIPVETLGRIYERFLGQIVKVRGRGVGVEDKPDVRKAKGVYYTPDYVVAYMAEQTLSPLVAGKSPREMLQISVMDSACGSGSFLIGAYSYLLQVMTRYWSSHKKDIRKGDIDIRDGQTHLSLKFRREVLASCIFGVDIDAQAVEVAQLSLYLKLLEEETTNSAREQQIEMGAALLPSLSSNIVVANSLMATEEHADLFGEPNQSAWSLRQTFPRPFRQGGFDVVLGNPPYIKEYTNREAFDGVRKSPYYEGKMDIWYMFACVGLDWVKPGSGRLAYIATNNWVTNAGAKKLRSKLSSEARIEQLIDFGAFRVFRDAGIQTMILIARRDASENRYSFDYRKLSARKPTMAHAQALLERSHREGVDYLNATFERSKKPSASLSFVSADRDLLLEKIRSRRNFALIGDEEVAQGIVAPQDFLNKKGRDKLGPKFSVGQGVFVLTNEELRALNLTSAERELVKPYYTTDELKSYCASASNRYWIIYTDSRFKNRNSMSRYPNLRKHLDQFAAVITSHNKPYGLHRSRDEKFFVGEKILALRKCKTPTFTFANFPCYVSQTFNIIQTNRVDLKYLTALLSSRVVRFWLRHRGKLQGHHFQVDKEPLLTIPLFVPTRDVQQAVAKLVDQIAQVKELARSESETDSNRLRLERRAMELESEINRVVDGLYGVTEADRLIMERSDADSLGLNAAAELEVP